MPPQGILLSDTKQIPIPPVAEEAASAEEKPAAPQAPPPMDGVSADEIKELGKEIFKTEEEPLSFGMKETPAPNQPDPSWRSQAPNGININRSGVEQLCLLSGVGPHLAQAIIDHRQKNGLFAELKDLTKVTGLGAKTYKDMVGMSTRSDLRTAELRLNNLLGVTEDVVSLSQIANAALKKFSLAGIFICSSDGLLLAQSVKEGKFGKFADPLSAVAPQLYKRGRRSLTQANLPECDMFTFFLGSHAVTFAGSDQVFCALVHDGQYPNQRQLRNSRKLVQELVWYCSHRAVM